MLRYGDVSRYIVQLHLYMSIASLSLGPPEAR